MSNETLQKAVEADTTITGTMTGSLTGEGIHVGASSKGGLLNPEQSSRFLDYMFDATVIGKVARTVRMRADTTEIDRIGVGERLMVVAAEADNAQASNAAVTFSKISLSTKKLRLDWELSTESLEDNIEGADLEDHIARLMATQAGNDIEDVILNGNTASTGLMSAFDGVVKKAKANGHNVDGQGAGASRALFNKALKALPRKYKQRRNDLRFLAGSNLVQDYLYSASVLGDYGSNNPQDIASSVIRGTTPGLGGPAGYVAPFAFGIPIVEVPLLDETQTGTYTAASGQHGDIHLTFPNNVVIGIKRDVTVYRFFWPKKDSIEYTMFTRVGVQIEQADAWVVVKNVKVAS